MEFLFHIKKKSLCGKDNALSPVSHVEKVEKAEIEIALAIGWNDVAFEYREDLVSVIIKAFKDLPVAYDIKF